MRWRRLEKHEQADGVELLRTIGATVYVLGTRRAQRCWNCRAISRDQGTRQTPGISDVLAFLPAPSGARHPVWIEFKREKGGKLTAEQAEFRSMCVAAGWDHVVAEGVGAVADYLKLGGWLVK